MALNGVLVNQAVILSGGQSTSVNQQAVTSADPLSLHPRHPLAKLVQPMGQAAWLEWQGEHLKLQYDTPQNSAALHLYQTIEDTSLRQWLESMLGVDIYV